MKNEYLIRYPPVSARIRKVRFNAFLSGMVMEAGCFISSVYAFSSLLELMALSFPAAHNQAKIMEQLEVIRIRTGKGVSKNGRGKATA